MRIKTTREQLTSSEKVNILAKSKITNITLVNQGNGTILTGLNNEKPVIQLGVGQSIAYDAGENSIWGDGFLKFDYQASTQKQVVILLTVDLGEI